MPNMEELISRISRKFADGPADEIWTSKFDLDYACDQLLLSKEARNLCIFAVTGGNFTGYYRFLKGFYGLADISPVFQEKTDQTLENKYPAWPDDIIVVTKGSKEQHKKELIDNLTSLENAGYRLMIYQISMLLDFISFPQPPVCLDFITNALHQCN